MMRKIVWIGLGLWAFGAGLWAQESASGERRHAFNVCPVAVAFGIYSANYMYLYDQTHGFDFRLETSGVSNDDMEVESRSYVFNYRYHLDHKMESLFIGGYVWQRISEGDGRVKGVAFDYDYTESVVGVNIGKRWVWKNGFNIVWSGGYGALVNDETVSPSSPAIRSAVEDFKEEAIGIYGALFGELSIGYVF